MDNELSERIFQFGIRCLKFLKLLPKVPKYKVIKCQLAKSSTSSGPNYEEAQAGSSRADFNNKVRIALREMRETNYWLSVIKGLSDNVSTDHELAWLINEPSELKLILGAIVQNNKE